MADNFDKYEGGAYHWDATHDAALLAGYSPRLEARYDLPLEVISSHVDLPMSCGLDIGCGDGAFLHALQQEGGTAVGADLSRQGLALYRDRAGADSLPVVRASAHDLPFKPESFDYATMIDVVEHVPDGQDTLCEISAILTEGGVCVVTTPEARAGEMESEYHVREYTADELSDVLAAAFDDVTVYGYGPTHTYERYAESRVSRQLIRLRSRLGMNPFTEWRRDPEHGQFRYLLGVGRLK
jgi:2-polyprenyl-3-methyl-5-hydroxy-6-metoxy-1,4-benzoquinol methylase